MSDATPKPAMDKVHCENCGQDLGYYTRLGKDYLFTCRYCGIERSHKGDIPAKAVLEIVHGNTFHEIAIIRKEYTLEEVKQIVMPYKYTIISAELRMLDGKEVSKHALLKESFVRSNIARVMYRYDWLVNFVGNYIEWRLGGKGKRRKVCRDTGTK